MQAIYNSGVEDSLPNHWINWCRLCAKEDQQNNINFLYENDCNLDKENKKSSIQEALEKYFCMQASPDDSLPKMLCTNCLSLVSSMINFNERVERVQLMFSHLAEVQISAKCLDLNAIRLKFDVTESERDNWFNNYSPAAVYKIYSETSINENDKLSGNSGKLGLQIKQEETENLVPLAHDNYVVHGNNSHKEEVVLDSDNNSLSGNEEDPFQNNEKEKQSSAEESEDEKPLQTAANKILNMFNKCQEDKTKKKRKRKKYKPYSSISDSKKKKISMKDFKIEASCKKCKQSFSKYMVYREHMQQQHDHSKSEKHWPCPACDKVLLSISNLERHVRIHVPLEVRQTIKCSECENRYTSNAQLETHIKYKHKNEKPFVCEECGLSLRTHSNLRQHMLTHTDVAPFECDICKKNFKNKTRLKSHMDIHSPNKHICNICGLQLNSRATLNRHFLVHSDDMQHKCDYCGKAFKRAKALKNHLLLHTGLKPYSCDFCERTFANGSNCRSHMKKMHPEDLAVLEASGNKTHTKNIPKLETLKAVTKAADNLTPVVTKFSGCFAFGKKPKQLESSGIKQQQKIKTVKNLKSLRNVDEKSPTVSPASIPLDLQYVPQAGNANSITIAKNIGNNLSTLSTTTAIPNFGNIYQHLLKHNQTDLKQPFTPDHNAFYHDVINHSIKPSPQPNDDLLHHSPQSHHSPMTPLLTHDDLSNPSSVQGTFYGSNRTNLPPGNFI